MSFVPRLLAPVVIMGMVCGTAAPQAAQPDGRCGRHMDAAEPRECHHRSRHHGSGRIK
jgi:hypothetical protein